jgi:hypothetical protein
MALDFVDFVSDNSDLAGTDVYGACVLPVPNSSAKAQVYLGIHKSPLVPRLSRVFPAPSQCEHELTALLIPAHATCKCLQRVGHSASLPMREEIVAVHR